MTETPRNKVLLKKTHPEATEEELEKISVQVAAGRLKDPDKIGVKVGKVINKRKVGKHFITDWRASHFPDCGSFRILDRKGRNNGGEVQDIFT